MNESQRLAEQLNKALNGEAWHGPSWREVLAGVARETAIQRPIADAHSLAALVLHMTTWNEVVRRRLLGEFPEITESENWSEANPASESAWRTARTRLFKSGNALVQTVANFPPARLHKKRPAVDGTWYELILGSLQHLLYHAGQAALLKKARS